MKAKYEISLKSVGVYAKYFMENGLSQFLYNYEKKRLLDRFKKEHQMIGPYYTECGELDGVVMGSDEIFALHTGPTPNSPTNLQKPSLPNNRYNKTITWRDNDI